MTMLDIYDVCDNKKFVNYMYWENQKKNHKECFSLFLISLIHYIGRNYRPKDCIFLIANKVDERILAKKKKKKIKQENEKMFIM